MHLTYAFGIVLLSVVVLRLVVRQRGGGGFDCIEGVVWWRVSVLLRRAWCGGLGAAHLVEAQLTCFRSCSASCLFAFLALEHFSLQLQTVVSVSQKYEFFERAIRTDQPTTDQRISQDESAVFVGVFLYIYTVTIR